MNYTHRQQREIFHFLFLERLLKIADPRLFVLKGGVNLRFFFASPRYSEDMDLDVLAGSVATLRKNGYRILEDPAFARNLATYGIARLVINDPAKAEQAATTQRFRAQLVNTAGESYPTRVAFSRRGGVEDYRLETLDPSIARAYRRLARRLSDEERTRARSNLLQFDYSDYEGQVLDYLVPESLGEYQGESRWNEICERVYLLLEAPAE